MFFWVKYTVGNPGTIEAESMQAARDKGNELAEAARAKGYDRGTVSDVAVIPYPADPVVFQTSTCPAFCYHPETCRGLTSCPERLACSE